MATQPGDCIFIVTGHGVPVIARPRGTATDNATGEKVVLWKMIGEAFVSGMMEGEMLNLQCKEQKFEEPIYFT